MLIKPRNSKNNPSPDLQRSKKAENREISRIRVIVEQAISGLKRFNIVIHQVSDHVEGLYTVLFLLLDFGTGNSMPGSPLIEQQLYLFKSSAIRFLYQKNYAQIQLVDHKSMDYLLHHKFLKHALIYSHLFLGAVMLPRLF